MQASYAADTNDAVLDDAAQASADGTIKLRVGTTIYNARTGNYVTWSGVSWTVVCDHADEARQVRDVLRELFQAIERDGPAVVMGRLRGAA